MRSRPTALTALAVGAALTLAACSETGGEDPAEAGTPTEASTSAGTELPTVEGGFGEEPTITFPDSAPPADLQVDVLHEGDGPEVGADDFVVADYHGQVWDTAEVFDTSFERDAPTGFSLNRVIPGWKEGLTGTHVGDRVLLSIPPELGYGEEGSGEDIPGGATLVFVVDVVDAYAPDAAGQADATPVEPAPELPVTVDGEPGGPATIAVDEGAAEPTEPEATVVATGSGDPLAQGSTALLQYALTTWDNATTESTWESSGVTSITVGDGTVFDLLADVPVGSRVVVQLPATPATEQNAEQPPIALVVDVVASVPPR